MQTQACDSTYSSGLPTSKNYDVPSILFHWQSEVPEDKRAGVKLEGYNEAEQDELEAAAEGEPPGQELHAGEVPFTEQ